MTQTIIKPSGKKALLIDGKAASAAVLERVAGEAAGMKTKPGLAVVLAGEDPASQVYVKSKGRAAHFCGFHSVQHDLPATTSEAELIRLVQTLNADPAIHGILVQLPLPAGIDFDKSAGDHRAGKGRGRLPSGQCRAAGDGADRAGADALHPGRRHGADRGGGEGASARHFRRRGGDHRALQHCRQADGATAAVEERHRHNRPFAHPRPAFRRAAGRHSGRGGRAARDDPGRLDQAGGAGDRRRDQPRSRGPNPDTRRASSATWRSTRRWTSPARSLRCRAGSAP